MTGRASHCQQIGSRNARFGALYFFILIATACFSLPARAEPTVISLDLVSSVRSGRTAYDYSYKIHVQADTRSYTDASFSVTSSNPATQVLDGTIALGAIAAGSVILSTDTFTIRQNRTTQFNPSSLKFSFSGTPAGVGNTINAPNIGAIQFMQTAGRPGHQGSFPIQGTTPPPGVELPMTVRIYGDTLSAGYRFLDSADNVLTEGVLTRTSQDPIDAVFFASVVTPTQPFTIEISAVSAAGSPPVIWRSQTYTPPPITLKIIPASGRVPAGQAVDVTLRIASASISGNYTISLVLPPQLTGSAGPWTVNVQPGQPVDVTTQVMARPDAFGYYTIVMNASSTSNPSAVITATLDLSIQ